MKTIKLYSEARRGNVETLTFKNAPKGWNSWDCYGASVTEEEVLLNAELMRDELLEYGWDTVVVDIQWYEPTADSSFYHKFTELDMDEYSRLIPSVNRFPSAKDGQGFKALGEKIHAMGLKFGIHIMRGIPRQAVHQNTPIKDSTYTAREIASANSIAPWNTDMYGLDPDHPGSQVYYDSLFELYASWGVDYIKVDDIADSKLYGTHLDEIKMIHKAIKNSGRPMVLSLSPGPANIEYAEEFQEYANLWRMTDDYWDIWELLFGMFERCRVWAQYVKEGSYPDCDMLPMGRIGIRSIDGGATDRMTRFTQAEQRTMMTLWSIFGSPLMFGGDLRYNDDFTWGILKDETLTLMHREVTSRREVSNDGTLITWEGISQEHQYTAIFNVSDYEVTIAHPVAGKITIASHDVCLLKNDEKVTLYGQ